LDSNVTMHHFGARLHALLSSLISHFVDKVRKRIGNPRDERALHCRDGNHNLISDKDDPKCGCPDITCVREVLGWEPRVPAAERLKTALELFAERVF
jgi:hypothetical protein